MSEFDPIEASLREASAVLEAFLDDPQGLASTRRFAELAAGVLGRGGRLFACGNGGSLCDAMHFAQEWSGRFREDRAALPAMAFSDSSQLTAIANDYGYERVFARLLEAHATPDDLLVLLSTSGSSTNLVRAAESARHQRVPSVGLLGRGGGKLLDLVDLAIVVPRARTADRVQEMHIKILHSVIEEAERLLTRAQNA